MPSDVLMCPCESGEQLRGRVEEGAAARRDAADVPTGLTGLLSVERWRSNEVMRHAGV
jgi:hypothetical protein